VPSEEEMVGYLVHEGGWMRGPVLLTGDLLVRDCPEAFYREALDGRGGS